MADNVRGGSESGTAPRIAADEVTYSGDTDAKVQLVRVVGVSGSEGSKTVDALSVPEGLSVQIRGLAGDTAEVDASGNLQVAVASAIPAGTNNIGDVDVLTLPADPLGANADAIVAAGAAGSISAKLRRATQGIEDLKTGIILAAGTANIGDVDVLTLPNVTLAAGTNTNEVVGDVAHDVAAAGNPLLNAGISQDTDDTAPPNRASAEGRTTRLATDRDGSLFVRTHGPQIWSYHEDSSSALTDATVHASPGSGLSLYVTDIVFSTGAGTACNIFFEEGSTKVLGPYYLEAIAGRGLVIHFGTPKKITAATALTVTTSAAIAHSIDVTGFVAQG